MQMQSNYIKWVFLKRLENVFSQYLHLVKKNVPKTVIFLILGPIIL
jgi:hypothetical protein